MNTAMVVAGGGFSGLPVLRALHDIGWGVVIADSVLNSPNRFEAEAFHHIPEATDFEAFRTAIKAVARHHRVGAIFPTTIYDLPAVATLKPELTAMGIRVFVSDLELIDILNDKLLTTSAALQAGLPMLPIVDPLRHDYSYPLIGKPRFGWGSVGMLKAGSQRDYQQLVPEHGAADDYLWQRKLATFIEWSVDFALAPDGQCSRLVYRQRLRAVAGFAVMSEITHAPEVEKIALQTAEWLGRHGDCGLFNIQILEEPDGALWLSDLNPRPGTSSVCALAAGLNLVSFLVGPQKNVGPARHGTVVRTLDERFFPKLEHDVGAVVLDLNDAIISEKSWMSSKLQRMTMSLHRLIDPEHASAFRLEALRLIDEGSWDNLIETAAKRSGLPDGPARELMNLWPKICPEVLVAHQDAIAFLHMLRTRGFPVVLLSDDPAELRRQKLAALPPDLRFDRVVPTDDTSAPKPDPEAFLVVARQLSMKPESLLMIGTSPWRDGLGAVRAGYAGALIIERAGNRSNPSRKLFEREFPDAATKIHWLHSLYGVDRMLNDAATQVPSRQVGSI